jgi:hypothetical protein
MERYKDIDNDSGVAAYEIGASEGTFFRGDVLPRGRSSEGTFLKFQHSMQLGQPGRTCPRR